MRRLLFFVGLFLVVPTLFGAEGSSQRTSKRRRTVSRLRLMRGPVAEAAVREFARTGRRHSIDNAFLRVGRRAADPMHQDVEFALIASGQRDLPQGPVAIKLLIERMLATGNVEAVAGVHQRLIVNRRENRERIALVRALCKFTKATVKERDELKLENEGYFVKNHLLEQEVQGLLNRRSDVIDFPLKKKKR